MDRLHKVALKIASQDPEIRRDLIAELVADKFAGRSMKVEEDSGSGGKKGPIPYVQKYIQEGPLKGKKFKNMETGRMIGPERNMQVNPQFKKKVYQDAKEWWKKQQKEEEKSPQAKRKRVVRNQVESATSEANKLIRDLESGKKKPSDVSADAEDHIGTLDQLYQRARKVDPDLGKKVNQTRKKLKQLTKAKRKKDAPTLRGRKSKKAAADYAIRMLFGE